MPQRPRPPVPPPERPSRRAPAPCLRPEPPRRPQGRAVRQGRDAMQALTDFVNNQPAWHWWALGALLLALEIASTTQYLLWPGIAALIVGVLKFAVPSLDGRLAV